MKHRQSLMLKGLTIHKVMKVHPQTHIKLGINIILRHEGRSLSAPFSEIEANGKTFDNKLIKALP